ncbi:hypothetical protein [Thalassoroseus pseudoceratinae]|uniref:hypothetical protein n=1 Tax=Thalassoroseus pseudoceratinae TaxID=2713176 RepID=UPI00141E93C9|nr:hypothetical protein [Thalassoroseus pseudoceratinae]
MNWQVIGQLQMLASLVFSIPNAVANSPAVAETSQQRLIEGWISQLTADGHPNHRAATEDLTKVGAEAVDAIASAAKTDDKLLTLHCVSVLLRMLSSDDVTTQTAAQTALKQLASSPNKFLANAAEQAITIKAANRRIRRGNPGGGLKFNGVMVPGVKNLRVQTKTVNGKRSIAIQMDKKKIEIADTNGQDITITVTEPREDDNGNIVRKPKTYTAKDYNELRIVHPDIVELYQRFAGRPIARPVPIPFRRPILNHVQAMKRQLKSMDEILERLEDRVKAGRLPQTHFDRIRQGIDRRREKLIERINQEETAEKVNAE